MKPPPETSRLEPNGFAISAAWRYPDQPEKWASRRWSLADAEHAICEAGAAVEGRLTCRAYDDFRHKAGPGDLPRGDLPGEGLPRENLPSSSSALSVLQRHEMTWREAVSRFSR